MHVLASADTGAVASAVGPGPSDVSIALAPEEEENPAAPARIIYRVVGAPPEGPTL